jgi:heat-inducible transcriptional repressor
MAPRRITPSRELHPRDLEILKDVILTHLLSAEPVSSRTVARYGGTDLSAASIRNVMADLEDWGYLSQPHASAGRVPTTAGYHLFIDSLMRRQKLPAKDRRLIEEHLMSGSGDADELMKAASRLLSELSSQVGIVVAPAIGQTVLKTVDFVPLSGRKVLCVVVSTGGFIDNKVIETEQPVSREKLIQIGNYLTDSFAGRTLVEIRDQLLQLMAEERSKMDLLLGLTIELAQKGLKESGEPMVRVDGTSMVLAYPELSDVQRVRRLLETFADKAKLVSMLNECIKGEGVRVLIGEDSDLTSELDFSLVATTYGLEDEVRGTLGIFGPSRMEYQRIIPLVHHLGTTLSKALARGFASDGGEEG